MTQRVLDKTLKHILKSPLHLMEHSSSDLGFMEDMNCSFKWKWIASLDPDMVTHV